MQGLGFSRRALLAATCGGLAYSLVPRMARSAGLQSLGIQLYTLREALEKDFESTLHQVAALGFSEVEFAGCYGRSARQISQALRGAGLKGASAHVSIDQLRDDPSRSIDFAAALGVKYLICAEPGVADRDRYARLEKQLGAEAGLEAFVKSLTLDDWRWNAELFNTLGALAKAAGLQFGYHNHTIDFHRFGDAVAYDELLSRTDPALVVMELDCAWAAASGAEPVEYLTKYPGRIRALHVKDIAAIPPAGKAMTAKPCEVGAGTIQWAPIFAAAHAAGVEHYFVEQDGNFRTSPIESMQASVSYLRALTF